jgi:2-polyprenyl-3-methyl-5-hydroxy-6-metoxy-1,4-benzoquinol methylase
VNCIICGSQNNRVAETFENYKVVECQDCAFAIVDPIPSPDDLDRLYNSKEYFTSHMQYDFDRISDEKIQKYVSSLIALHSSNLNGIRINPAKKFLEVGPGGGFAMKAFEKMGFQVSGLETSLPASEFIRERLKLEVINSSFEDYRSSEKYDIILLNHVFEHFLDPISSIIKLKQYLSEDGVLYLRLPDHDSYDRRTYKDQWPAYAHYHISNFSQKSLEILASKNGMEVIKTIKYVSEKAPNWVKWMVKLPFIGSFMIKQFNGRTISVIMKNKKH